MILARDECVCRKRLWFIRTICLNMEWAKVTVLICACQIGVILKTQQIIINSDYKVMIEFVLGLKVVLDVYEHY